MSNPSPRLVGRSLLVVSVIAAIALAFSACTADGDTDPTPADETPDAQPPVVLPPSSTPEGGNQVDSGPDSGRDAGKDAKSEASVDAGKPAPNQGDPCKTLDEIFTRTCGACGKQYALCLAKDDGTAGIVSEYGQCEGELPGGCIPGTVENEACGNCGTRKRTCTAFCAWTIGACGGEPPASCTPTANDYTTAGCPTVGTVRTRQCSATCSWNLFSGTCEPLDFKLTVSGTPGESVTEIYPLRATRIGKRLTGTCPNATLSTTTNHTIMFVELVNPTDTTLTLSAWNTVPTAGATVIDTTMAWYDSASEPVDDASRKACTKGVVDACPSGLPCGDTKWAGLTGTNSIVIAPMSSVTLYFGSYYTVGASSPAEGNVRLVVRTDSAL